MKRILVTGARGFIGRHCLPLLLASGHEVHAVSSQEAPDSLGFLTENLHWHQADLLNLGRLPSLLQSVQATHLLHLAWVVTPGVFWHAADNFRWVTASLELLRLFAQNGGERVVTAGTCAEYDWKYGYCREGVTPLQGQTTYGMCKQALCLLQESLSLQSGISAAWGRVFLLYGPHEAAPRLVPAVIRSLLAGQPALCSHGEQIRDLLHVEDVAAAFVALLESEARGAVNIASGRAVALKEVIGSLARLENRPDLVRLGAIPAAPDEPPLLVADVRRLRDEVGWAPRYELDAGLAQTLSWWRKVGGGRTPAISNQKRKTQ